MPQWVTFTDFILMFSVVIAAVCVCAYISKMNVYFCQHSVEVEALIQNFSESAPKTFLVFLDSLKGVLGDSDKQEFSVSRNY